MTGQVSSILLGGTLDFVPSISFLSWSLSFYRYSCQRAETFLVFEISESRKGRVNVSELHKSGPILLDSVKPVADVWQGYHRVALALLSGVWDSVARLKLIKEDEIE